MTAAPLLVITQGLPASGKTTWAREWVAEADRERVRVNRDDLRNMTVGGWTGVDEHEWAVTVIQHAAVALLLDEGRSVVCDDTNLQPDAVEVFKQIAARHGAALTIADFTDVPLDVCIRRDRQRQERGDRAVGEQVIRSMHKRYLACARCGAALAPPGEMTVCTSCEAAVEADDR